MSPSDSTRPLAGRRALVTAASSGIGRATAARLRSQGAEVFITGASERTAEVARELGAAGYAIADFTEPSAPAEAAAAAATRISTSEESRTKADGSYELLVYPNQSYIVAVTEEKWAAPPKTGIVVKEGEPRTGLDFSLGKGTIVRGLVTTGHDNRIVPLQTISVIEQGSISSP